MTTRFGSLILFTCVALLTMGCGHAEVYPGEPQPLELDEFDQPRAEASNQSSPSKSVPPPEPPPSEQSTTAESPVPAPVPPPTAPAAVEVTTLGFASRSKVLDDDGLSRAKEIADELMANPGTVIELAGFGDANGDKTLGAQRATFVRSYLKMLGASPAQMQAAGRSGGGPGRVEIRVLEQ